MTTSKSGSPARNCSMARSTDMIHTGTAVTPPPPACPPTPCQLGAPFPVPFPILRSAAVQSASAAFSARDRMALAFVAADHENELVSAQARHQFDGVVDVAEPIRDRTQHGVPAACPNVSFRYLKQSMSMSTNA